MDLLIASGITDISIILPNQPQDPDHRDVGLSQRRRAWPAFGRSSGYCSRALEPSLLRRPSKVRQGEIWASGA
jgi:hypothetical protein